MSGRRLRLQVKPNIAGGGPRLVPKSEVSTTLPPQTSLESAAAIVSEKVISSDLIPSSTSDDAFRQNEQSSTIVVEEINTEETTNVDKNDYFAVPSTSAASDFSQGKIVTVENKSTSTSTPVLVSLLGSPSKYRNRLHVRPNLPTSEKRFNNFDETDNTGGGPIVAASNIISHKIPEPVPRSKKRRFDCSQELDRSLFTMADLIYWNPENGPALQRDAQDDEDLTQTIPVYKVEENTKSRTSEKEEDLSTAPKVRVNADGSIVIDESSLTIKKTRDDDVQFETVRESNRIKKNRLTSFSFRRNPIIRPKTWTEKETDKFYKILKMVGTDFSMMAEYFPKRRRQELKNKFRKESKENPSRIDAAMIRSSSPLRIPRRLLPSQNTDENDYVYPGYESDEDNDDNGATEDVSKNEGDSESEESEEDVEEQLFTMFRRPTRFGRRPKPVKLPEEAINSDSLPKWKRRRRKKFAEGIIDSLTKAPKEEDEKKSLMAPGPSTFPKYTPVAKTPPPDVVLEPGTPHQIVATATPGQQILLVHEKAKETGKPDLVHIYLVSSPNVAGGSSSSLSRSNSQQDKIGLNVTINDNRTSPNGSGANGSSDPADAGSNEISLTIETNDEVMMNAADTDDVILVDI